MPRYLDNIDTFVHLNTWNEFLGIFLCYLNDKKTLVINDIESHIVVP
jgi:hypothetical protein